MSELAVGSPSYPKYIQVLDDFAGRLAPDLRRLQLLHDTQPVDTTLLTDEVLGHGDLAQELGKFVATWQQYARELTGHLDVLAEEAATVLDRYQQTDADQERAFTVIDGND